MNDFHFPVGPVALAVSVLLSATAAHAQSAAAPATPASAPRQLQTIKVNASADASQEGLTKPYAGGQVARGGRVGILGNQDVMDTPFNSTSYTNELIQNQQARSVGDVLLNDPSVRVARGFGNFQESYFIRGFILNSDDIAYNGLYSLLPRQYIAAELFERVEVLRGASAFLNGAAPGGDAIGGSINLLPKRAPNEPLTQVTFGVASGSQTYVAADVARRFGPDQATGIRINGAWRNGGTGIDNEHVKLGVGSIGLDWHSRDVRLSADVGYQDNRLNQTRTNVTLVSTTVPSAPDAKSNWAQPWSYSNERDTFGTFRGEFDIASNVTAWAAYGARRSSEANSLANLTVNDATTGAGTTYRFDNTRKDEVDTGEVGVRAKVDTGSVSHTLVASASAFHLDKKTAYGFSAFNGLATNLYAPVNAVQPALPFTGNTLSDPARTGLTKLTSFAVGDTLGFLGDTVLLIVGARYQKLDITNYNYGSGSVADSYDRSRTSPVVGAVWKLRPDVSVYGNYIESLAQGETAPSTAANLGQILAPYVAKQKEVGVKYDGGRLGGSLALFSTTKPRGFVDPTTNIFGSQGKDEHQGAELSVFGEPVRGVRVLGGVTWLDAKQKSTGSATTEGKKVIGVPETQANIGAEWDIPGVRGLSVNGRLVYTSKFYADAANTLSVPNWTRLDLGARYMTDLMGRLVTFRARVDNATNKSYWASSGGYPNSGYLVLGAPRTFNVSASIDF